MLHDVYTSIRCKCVCTYGVQYELNRSRWCSVKTRSHYHSVNPKPEHPACLISKETAVIIPSHPEMAHTKAVILLFISNPINRSDYMYRKVDAKLISTAHKLSLRNTLRNYSVKEYW